MTVAAIFLPLIASIIAGFFGRWIGDRGAQLVTCAAVLISAVLAIFIFFQVAIGGQAVTVDLFNWMDTGDLQVEWALRFDTLSAVMISAAREPAAAGSAGAWWSSFALGSWA